jgi:hypothetical protein
MRFIFLGFAVLFMIAWVLAFIAFHVAGFFVHILLILAVILFVMHLFRQPRTP